MPKQQPQRTCIATGETHPQALLWRFAAGLDGRAHLDVAHKAPGRGAYLVPTKQAFDLALKRKAFSRHLDVQPPSWEVISAQLTKKLQGQLGLARKAGQLIVGTDMVFEALQKQHINAVLVAVDAAPNTIQKVTSWQIPTYQLLTKTDYEQALGVANATVVGVKTSHPVWHAATQLQSL